MNDIFRFKKFSVINADAGLKVGTDGVLLGAVTTLPEGTGDNPPGSPAGSGYKILDIGTGTGLVALMLAQRLADRGNANAADTCPDGPDFKITGIEIDSKAADIAARNFEASPWAEHLSAIHRSLQDFADDIYVAAEHDTEELTGAGLGRYDLIVSNPPYFENSLKAPDQQRSTARHTDTLSYRECVTFASDYLTPTGSLSLILPKQEEMHLIRFAASFGLYPSRIVDVKTTASKAPKRIIAELSRTRTSAVHATLVLQNGPNLTAQWQELTREFYL